MDYLEVTKNESLRKYEENIYLLGTIFSTKEPLSKDINNPTNDLKMDGSHLEDEEIESNEDDDSDSDSDLDDDIYNLFESKLTSVDNDKLSAITNLINKNFSISDVNNPSSDTNIMFEQLANTLDDYNDCVNLFNQTKESFVQDSYEFKELNTK